MALRKRLTEEELKNILEDENWSDDDPDFVLDDDSDCSEDDHDSIASEVSDDHSEILSDNEDGNTSDICHIYTAKDGTTWNSEAGATGRARCHNIINTALNKVVLQPGTVLKYPVDAFDLFINEPIVSDIVRCTNQEAHRVFQDKNISRPWKDCDEVELRAFFGLLLTAGHLKMNHTNYDTLWNSIYGPPIFRATMGIKRFKYLLSFLRFDDKSTRSARREKDKFAPLRDVWEQFNGNLKKHYQPGTDITVDEMLIPFRGRCPFKRYIPSKPDKYGMMVWWACDAKTFYPLNGLPYTGKEDGVRALPGLSSRVVESLTEPYQKTQRNITCDNYFTDKQLADNLLSKGLTLVGTVRKNKRFIPREFQPQKTRPEYSSVFGFTRESTLVSYVPKKSKAVVLLSTMHHTNTCSQDKNNKPEIILHYNSTKGGVDALDQLVHAYSCQRKTNRWPCAFFMNCLNVAGVASYVVWMNINPMWNGKKHDVRNLFLTELSESLIQPQIERRKTVGLQRPSVSAMQLYSQKGSSSTTSSSSGKKKRCHLCPYARSRTQKQTCSKCHLSVCNEHSDVTRLLKVQTLKPNELFCHFICKM